MPYEMIPTWMGREMITTLETPLQSPEMLPSRVDHVNIVVWNNFQLTPPPPLRGKAQVHTIEHGHPTSY